MDPHVWHGEESCAESSTITQSNSECTTWQYLLSSRISSKALIKSRLATCPINYGIMKDRD